MDHTSSATISDVFQQGGRQQRVGPVLVKFEHGNLNHKAIGSFNHKISYDFKSSRGSSEVPYGTAPNINLELQADGLVYSSNAPAVKHVNRAQPYQRTFLAVRNKRTQRIRLIEANTVTLAAIVTPPPSSNPILIEQELKQKEDSILITNKEPNDQDTETKVSEKNRLAVNKNLVREFGQKKGKRIYEQNDRMQVDSDILNDKLSQAAMTVEHSSLETFSTARSTSELTPPCNRDATQVQHVYSLENGILDGMEISKLQSAATALVEEYPTVDSIRQGIETKQFSQLFGKVFIREHREVEPTKLAVALYMEAIVNFIGLKSREFAKGPRGMQYFVPTEMRQKVFRNFTNELECVVPETRDRAICYVIVLALMVNDYCVKFSDLTSSLRIKADQLKRLIRVTGARLQLDVPTKNTFVVLKLPLDVFDPSAPVKKMKRRTM